MIHWIQAHTGATIFIALCQLPWIAAFAWMVWKIRDTGRISAHRATPIAQAAVGTDVKLEGKAVAIFDLASTLLARPVAWFEWYVEERSTRWESDKPVKEVWSRVDGGRSVTPFAIEDAQGRRVLLLPEAAKVYAAQSDIWYGPTLMPTRTESVEPYDYRYVELFMDAGTVCTVVGRLEPARPEDGANLRGVIRGGGDLPFVIGAGDARSLGKSMGLAWLYPAMIGVVSLLFAVVAAILVVSFVH